MLPESKDELIDTPSLTFLCALLGAALVSHLHVQQQVTPCISCYSSDRKMQVWPSCSVARTGSNKETKLVPYLISPTQQLLQWRALVNASQETSHKLLLLSGLTCCSQHALWPILKRIWCV